MNVDESMLEVYIYETQQLLESLEDTLLRGEKEKRLDSDDINEVFRVMHTIKGASAMMEFENMAKLAHSLEDMFSFIRDSGAPQSEWPNIFDLVFSAVAFFIKAIVVALKQFPVFNAKLDEVNEVIRLEKEYNIGIATDTEQGLIVPVIHHADQLTVRQINDKLKELTKKSQEDKLTSTDLKGGTFTISNVGPLGSIGATPIINHPETGLIAFHKTKKMPVVMDNDEIAIRSIMTLSMAFDHRVADGATAVSFTNRFKQLIENPSLWPIELV
jgi:pyruvate/2-oxoglutarate dehydrogenase complex dihydrolipoamide acyltransferase (E2) component